MRTVILIQARMSSRRFPGKMLASLGGIPLIEYVFQRCATSKYVDTVGIITSTETSDDPLHEYCISQNMPVFRGPLNDVLKRYLLAADFFNGTCIVRICGDSPFVAIDKLDAILAEGLHESYDYLSINGVLNGFLFELIKKHTLQHVQKTTTSPEDCEHVTYFIKKNLTKFQHIIVPCTLRPSPLAHITLTIDTVDDLILANNLTDNNLTAFDFTSEEILNILASQVLAQ